MFVQRPDPASTAYVHRYVISDEYIYIYILYIYIYNMLLLPQSSSKKPVPHSQ